MMYKALKHLGIDRPPQPPPDSRYYCNVAWIIYPGNDGKAECDSAIALILQHYSKNPCASSSTATSTPQSGPSSVDITSLVSLSCNASFTPPSDLSIAIFKLRHPVLRILLHCLYLRKVCICKTLGTTTQQFCS